MDVAVNPRMLFVGSAPDVSAWGNKWFDPGVAGEDTVRGYLVDRNFKPPRGDDMPHLQAALATHRLIVGSRIPQHRPFDVAYIALSSGDASLALRQIGAITRPPKWIILENPPALNEESENRLARLLDLARFKQKNVLVNQPYLLSDGVRCLHEIADHYLSPDNPITRIQFKYQNHGRRPSEVQSASELGFFGLELARVTPVIESFLGSKLTADRVRRNFQYQSIFDDPTAQAAYTEFRYEMVGVHLSQIVGDFPIGNFGKITKLQSASQPPPLQRQICLEFKNLEQLELELAPALDARALNLQGVNPHSILTIRTHHGSVSRSIPDDPVKKLIRSVIDGLRQPSMSPPQGLDPPSALQLCARLRRMRTDAVFSSYPARPADGRGRPRLS